VLSELLLEVSVFLVNNLLVAFWIKPVFQRKAPTAKPRAILTILPDAQDFKVFSFLLIGIFFYLVFK